MELPLVSNIEAIAIAWPEICGGAIKGANTSGRHHRPHGPGRSAEYRSRADGGGGAAGIVGFPRPCGGRQHRHSGPGNQGLVSSLRDPDATPRKGLPVICLLSKSSSQQVRDLVKVVVDHVMIQPISATALRDNPMPQINVAKFTGPDRRRAKAHWRERKKILLM